MSLKLLTMHLIGRDFLSFEQHARQLSQRRDSRSSGLTGSSMIYAGQQSKVHTERLRAPVYSCVYIELRLPSYTGPDQFGHCSRARALACTQSVNPELRFANLGLGEPTCENQAADIPRSREFSNKFDIKRRFLYIVSRIARRPVCDAWAPSSRRSSSRQMNSHRSTAWQKIKFNYHSLADANSIISMQNISPPGQKKKIPISAAGKPMHSVISFARAEGHWADQTGRLAFQSVVNERTFFFLSTVTKQLPPLIGCRFTS